MDSVQFRNWFRTIKFFEGREGWYFLSPEGLAVGPYGTERTAAQQAARLAKVLKCVNDAALARRAVVEFMLNGGRSGPT